MTGSLFSVMEPRNFKRAYLIGLTVEQGEVGHEHFGGPSPDFMQMAVRIEIAQKRKTGECHAAEERETKV